MIQSLEAPKKIAIVGSGVSGLVVAHLLHPGHEITLYEAGSHIGGHTHTHAVEQQGRPYQVDTGFIVYNEKTYPNFINLLEQLGVVSQPSNMSFSVQSAESGLEYNGTSLNHLFAQRLNLLRPSFHRMLRDIFRFYREAGEMLEGHDHTTTLGAYLADNRYGDEFVRDHIIPMGAAVWSADPAGMYEFPASSFIRFFHNHGFLQRKNRPRWRVIQGGSHRYVEVLTRPFTNCIKLNTPVQSITRHPGHVEIRAHRHAPERFDEVVIAAHSDQALSILDDPTPAESQILGALRYQRNETVLHTDAKLLPRKKLAWASWNYYLPRQQTQTPTVTYNMNMLQTLESPRPFCVSLNRQDEIDHTQTIKCMTYHHPIFDLKALDAQDRKNEISGRNRTHYCGAYWGHGFHEDGVRSGLDVAKHFGKEL